MTATVLGSAMSRRVQRRVIALLQLALFVFSTSSSLLPCAFTASSPGGAQSHDAQSASLMESHSASHAVSHAVSHEVSHDHSTQRPLHHAPGTPMSSSTCPWVVGCVGMVQFDLDASFRVVESVTVNSAPIGVTLRQMVVDRDVDSPPPRA